MTGPRVHTLRVTSREAVAEGVVALVLEHPDGDRLPDWTPGAHLDLVLPNGFTRQYSLCGDRWDAHRYRIAVLREPDGRGGSAFVHDHLRPGSCVGVGGPRNSFPLVPADRYLFVAGGIGITPLLPMIHQVGLLGADWRLVYGGRRRATMAFLGDLARHGDHVQVIPEDESGRPDLHALLAEVQPGLRVYCCGPPGLIDVVTAACAHWPANTLRTERFATPPAEAAVRDAPFRVELARSGTSVLVAPGETVLEAVRSAGVELLFSCLQGTCGTCETTVIDGLVDHRDAVLTAGERAVGDRMFPCVSRSRGDRLLLDL